MSSRLEGAMRSRTNLEMALGDAEVDGCVAGENGETFLRLHFVVIV